MHMFHCTLLHFNSLRCVLSPLQNWWACTTYSSYYRKWNLVVHDWIHSYIYQDMKRVSEPAGLTELHGRHSFSTCISLSFSFLHVHSLLGSVLLSFQLSSCPRWCMSTVFVWQWDSFFPFSLFSFLDLEVIMLYLSTLSLTNQGPTFVDFRSVLHDEAGRYTSPL